MAIKLGLIGYPLGHSMSAVIHKAGLESIGLNGEYEILETPAEDLIQRIKFLKANDYSGFNVTIPLKVPMKLFINHIDETCDITGCVNTIKIRNDRSFEGFNTDIFGFKKAISQSIQNDLRGKNASIIGTGGASRAACVGLCELGVKQINFFSRNIINASDMVNYFRRKFPDVVFNIYQNSSTGELFKSAMIVNASPIGMRGHSADEMPLKLSIIKDLPNDTVIYDIVYNPHKTKLIEYSKEYGLETISGLDMLIWQAVKAQEIWTGKTPDFSKMKIAALENL